jgi:hypothetical protein
MKKILIAIIILLLGVIAYLLCCCCKKKPVTESCNYGQCKDYSRTPWEGKINANLLQQLSLNYRADSGKKYIWNGRKCSDSLDATSIWFSLEKLKRFIWQIESQGCKDNCLDTLIGIRLYYIRYPDTTGMRAEGLAGLMPSTYAQHHSIAMVPTYWDFNLRKNIDYDPKIGCHKPFDMSPTAKPGVIFFIPPGGGDGGNGQNHGDMAPPPASEGVFPTTPPPGL